MAKKSKPKVTDLTTECEERLDNALEKVAADLQHAFDSLGINMAVRFERKTKGERT
jgi:hypothetical protein